MDDYYKIGEVFELFGKKYITVENDVHYFACDFCAFHDPNTQGGAKMECMYVGGCGTGDREDMTEVYFKEVPDDTPLGIMNGTVVNDTKESTLWPRLRFYLTLPVCFLLAVISMVFLNLGQVFLLFSDITSMNWSKVKYRIKYWNYH